MNFHEKVNLIAELSEAILEDPERAFDSITVDGGDKAPSRMRQLMALAAEEQTSKLAIMSLLAVFRDIIPSYRIRLPTKQELATKVSKETKKVWDYERQLIHYYQQYLKLLEKSEITGVLCLCELFKKAFHFNFRNNVLDIIVKNINQHEACAQAIEYVFQNDSQGEVAFEASKSLAKFIKDKHFKVKPYVLRTFIQIPLRVHADEAQAAKLATQANKKKRKRNKEIASIESELKEGDATIDKLLLARCQSDTLETVITTYFRILKSPDITSFHIKQLLPPTLEGLAKFAHLINIDTVMDVLEVLKHLLTQVHSFPLDASLNCVLTAFETLQGPGRELQIDQKEYIIPLYSQLPRLIEEPTSHNTRIILKCLHFAFVSRREFSTVRIAAFFKQITTVALHTPANVSVPLLAFARQLLHRYSTAQQLLENEQDVITSGQYTPEVEDPEHANPFSTSAWELATLRFHIQPSICKQAQAASQNKLLQMPAEIPERLLDEETAKSDIGFVQFQHSASGCMKKHPLTPKDSDKKQNARFVTPRKSFLSEDELFEQLSSC